jgi:F0F1-type ATP synthase assembly protein I
MSLRKISQALTLNLKREVHLTTPGSEKPKDPQAEYDRLMHNKPKGGAGRKTISGSEFAGIGLQFAVVLVVFALAGVWLDRKLGTSPLLVIVLVLGGSGLGFWSMVRRVNRR